MPDAYILCATPRSGSTLLCGLLAATGRTGNPDSFYRPQSRMDWVREWGLPDPVGMDKAEFDRSFLEAAIRAGRGDTGIFGLRLMRENLEELSAILDRLHPGLASDRARFEWAFGEVLYIHLSREDTLAQAVSLVRAEQTGLWHVAPDGTELERLAPPEPPRYDFDRIGRAVAGYEAFEAAWVFWFKEQGIEPLRIGYERLSADPVTTLVAICEALQIRPPKTDAIRPEVAKLADSVSRDWMRRYRSDLAAAERGGG